MKQNIQKAKPCVIPADVFRRIYLYTIIGEFDNGVYGAKRLQKTAYISERDKGIVKPFTYKKHLFGQYSEHLDEIKEQLISLGFVKASPLDTATKLTITVHDKTYEGVLGGNRYTISDRDIFRKCESIVLVSQPELMKSTKKAIDQYGYKKEQELINCCYDFEEFKDKKEEDIIFESNLPEWVEMPELSDDECDELILSFTPSFMGFVNKITEGLERTTIDWGKVGKVVLRI